MNIFYTSIFTDKFPYTEEKILLDEFEIKNFKDVIIEYFLIYNDNSFQKIIKTIEHLESLHLNLDDINSIKRDFLKATEFILEFHSKNNKELNDHIEPIFDNIFELTRYTEDCNDHFIKLNGIYNKKYNIDKTPSSPNSPITLEEFNKILELISSLSNLIKIADHPDKMTHYIIVNKYCHHIKKVIPLIHQCEDNFNIYSLENLKKLLEEKKNIISDEIKKLS